MVLEDFVFINGGITQTVNKHEVFSLMPGEGEEEKKYAPRKCFPGGCCLRPVLDLGGLLRSIQGVRLRERRRAPDARGGQFGLHGFLQSRPRPRIESHLPRAAFPSGAWSQPPSLAMDLLALAIPACFKLRVKTHRPICFFGNIPDKKKN